MNRRQWKALVWVSSVMVVVGWMVLVAGFWAINDYAHRALIDTAIAFLIPGGIGVTGAWIFEEELVTNKPDKPMRCTDCGTKILNAGGTTIGDQIEGQVMLSIDPREGHRERWR